MSSNHRPEQNGALSRERKPQVVVRAGKTYVCSSCGTLVEIPADVVGQLVIAVDPSQSDETVEPSPVSEKPSRTTPIAKAPPRPKRPQPPKRVSFTGETIDGLRVPSAKQLDRAFSWVTFHLKVLDRQGSEIKRLKNLLSKERVPCPRPRGHAMKAPAVESIGGHDPHSERHAHEDVGMVPERRPNCASQTSERGPPKNPVPSPSQGEG
ncbi:hypothetical protein Pan97_13540 [Bremerella volcania]|uniref:Uncharacterized protein n=1 Tax=Bremerella volcania TaxID=2527984 RepID=A0A518C551_9BACT|nr:hypothetical protein [Bremerella volcania]QDU74347.1 hypothetical protein Pan97_13540 [Bremerella volcania]